MGVKAGLSYQEKNICWWCFEQRGLRRIFGPNRKKVPARWRKLRNEELHGFISPRTWSLTK